MTYGSTPMSISRVTTDGASSVCSVESTRWPVCAACIAIFAVSASRISPSRMTSGSCRRIDRSALRERQLDLLVDLRLVDAGNLVLDRILDRDDVGLLRLHRRQRRAERRRLAAAGRADDENHPVLMAEEARGPPRAPSPTCRSPRAAARPCGDRARASRSSRRRACAASTRGSPPRCRRRPSRGGGRPAAAASRRCPCPP